MGPLRHVAVAGAVALSAVVAAGAGQQQAKAEQLPSRQATLAALHRCFVQQVRHHHRAGAAPDANHPLPFDPAPLGPSSEIFFFDQLAAAEREMNGPARLLWCRPWFSAPYLRAQGMLSRRSKVARRAQDPNAAPRHHFSPHTDATRVLRAAAHAGGLHPVAELARVAIEALADYGGGPSPVDADWLAVTTLVPELYLYEAQHAHAFTPDTGQAPVPLEVERARRRFVAHVRQSVAAARAADAEGRHEGCLLHLGIAAHAIYDLYLHRGMTEREHAGLVFARQQNPDVARAEAVAADARTAIAALYAAVWPADAGLTVRWSERGAGERPPAPRTRRLQALVATTFRHARETDFATAQRRWALAYTYAPAGARAEDDDVLRAALAGRWDVSRTLADIWRQDGG